MGHFKIHAAWTCWFCRMCFCSYHLNKPRAQKKWNTSFCDDALDSKWISTFGNFTDFNLKATLHLMNHMHKHCTCAYVSVSHPHSPEVPFFDPICQSARVAHAKCIKFKVIWKSCICSRSRNYSISLSVFLSITHSYTNSYHRQRAFSCTHFMVKLFQYIKHVKKFHKSFRHSFHQLRTISQIIASLAKSWAKCCASSNTKVYGFSHWLFLYYSLIKLLRIIEFDLAFG